MKTWLSTLVLIMWACTAYTVELELKSVTDVSRSGVFLADVVSSSVDIGEEVLHTQIIPSPNLGDQQKINRTVIENALRNYLEGKKLSWTGSMECIVRRPARWMTVEETTQIIQNELKKVINGQGTCRVLELTENRPFYVPAGPLEITVSLSPSIGTSAWSTATLRCSSGGETVLTRSIRFHWAWEREVWQANRALAVGSPIMIEDFHKTVRNVLEIQGRPEVRNLATLDAVTICTLQTGAVLTETASKPRALVKRGNPVLVHYQEKVLSLSMKGRALEDGCKGQRIAVLNELSQKRIYARVLEEGVLEYVH